MQLVHIPLNRLEDFLPRVWHRLSQACERSGGKYEPGDVARLLFAQQMQLFSIMEGHAVHAIVTTEIINYPGARVCRVLATTGDNYPAWVDLIERLEAWASDNGCSVIEAVARPGWEKPLKSFGYAKTHCLLEKRLCPLPEGLERSGGQGRKEEFHLTVNH